MKIETATNQYEAWLASQISWDEEDLQSKHQKMHESPFRFLRATFYRWAQLWPKLCPELMQAPQVLSVGDLHTENFGIWRNSENGLVWGINDFDEALPLPYPQDLTRLASSVYLAKKAGLFEIKFKKACQIILDGYIQSMQAGGKPFLRLDQPNWLQKSFSKSINENKDDYWNKLRNDLGKPAQAPAQIEQILGPFFSRLSFTLHKRVAGMGSLGKQRWVGIAKRKKLAWEAKSLTFSAWYWANPSDTAPKRYYQEIIEKAVRSHDDGVIPLEKDGWVLRQLSPERVKLDLKQLDQDDKDDDLLFNMGWETANIHLASPQAQQAVLADIKGRPADWLREASKLMALTTQKDWEKFCRYDAGN